MESRVVVNTAFSPFQSLQQIVVTTYQDASLAPIEVRYQTERVFNFQKRAIDIECSSEASR